jgi:hypothetical protein
MKLSDIWTTYVDNTAHFNPVKLSQYLKEEAERRGKFEAEVLERLGKLERKTSSTEMVTLHEEPIEERPNVFIGRSFRVRWQEPYPPKDPA